MPKVDVSAICEALELDEEKCETLAKMLPEVCPPCTRITKEKAERKTSKWQECLRKERTGKKFDPAAIKELAKKYKAGQCP